MKKILLFLFCLGSQSAIAQMSLCNQTSDSLRISVALETQGELVSLGWQDLGPRECLLSVQELYGRMGISVQKLEALWVHGRDRLNFPSRQIGQGHEVCVDDVFDQFFVEFADSTCEKRGYVRASFSKIDFSRPVETGRVMLTRQGLVAEGI